MMGSEVARTLALVGKSATGNSTCELHLQGAVLEDDQIFDVIATPGLFDSSGITAMEFAKCIDLAKNGIRAVLVVFSLTTSFSEDYGAALEKLSTVFGSKILDYVIVVFTAGDTFADAKETFEDHLLTNCPQSLKDFLLLCGNRFVLYDNLTKDETKISKQVDELVALMDKVKEKNGGQPYSELKDTTVLEQRRKADEEADLAQKSLDDEMQEQCHKILHQEISLGFILRTADKLKRTQRQ